MDCGVFINYRVEDSHSYGALLYTELARQFGEDRVFLDCESIPAGADFVEELLVRVRSARVLLAVIGPRWLTATDRAGQRRIDNPDDWIRRELAEAFAAGVRVIPVLTEQTEIPDEADLPADIAALSRCQYRRLRHHDPTTDLARIVTDLTSLDPTLAASARHRKGGIGKTALAPHFTDLDRAAVLLAQRVHAQWNVEIERRASNPRPLKVSWRTAPDFTDDWANINQTQSHAGLPDLAGRWRDIVGTYQQVPSGRLVILGEPGAGKTILAMELILALLEPGTRTANDPVPVLLNVGGWDPSIPIRDWLTDHLIRDYPGLSVHTQLGGTLAAGLVNDHRILPVLDGFDEIAHGLHGAALEALNKASTMPLVVTSRIEEFESAVTSADRRLARAAAIRLDSLTRSDLTDYLPVTTRRTPPDWTPVLTRLDQDPDGPVMAALSTPLMAGLARKIYSETPGHDPANLLQAKRSTTRDGLEKHLLEEFIPAVYQPSIRGAGRQWRPEAAHRWLRFLARHMQHQTTSDLAWWNLGNAVPRALRGLLVGLIVSIAVELAFAAGPGLELRSGIGPSLLLGVAVGLAVGIRYSLTGALTTGIVAVLIVVQDVIRRGFKPEHLDAGIVLVPVFLLVYRHVGRKEPTPSKVRFRRSPRRRWPFWRIIRFGLAGGLLAAVIAGYRLIFQTDFTDPWSWVPWYLGGLASTGIAVGTVAGLFTRFEPRLSLTRATLWFGAGIAAYMLQSLMIGESPSWIDLPVLAVIAITPSYLRRDQTGVEAVRALKGHTIAIFTIGGGLLLTIAGIVHTLLAGEGWTPGGFLAINFFGIAGALVGFVASLVLTELRAIFGSEQEIVVGTVTSPRALLASDRRSAIRQALTYTLVVGVPISILNINAGIVLGVISGIMVLARKAWVRWLIIARLWLPLTRRLPWRLSSFLDDAHHRGVLRQAGAVYQFRHERLRDHLVDSHTTTQESHPGKTTIPSTPDHTTRSRTHRTN